MPNYQFQDKKGNILEYYFPINEAPSIGTQITIEGKVYTRLPSDTQMAIDTKIDCFDKKKFLEKTRKQGKMGEIFDLSKELGNKRKEKAGKDEFKEKFIESSKKKRNGKFIG